jgi:quercetin dioxygenase-like cupin family protein
MRPFGLVLSVIAFVLLSLVALGSTVTTRAQEATPLAGGLPFEIAPGVTADILPASEDPPSLYRIRFAPGVVYELEVSPAVSLVYVEAGTLVLRLDAPLTVTRAGETDAPGEAIAADTEVTLGPGDYTVFPPNVSGEARNDGEEPAQVAAAELIPAQLEMSRMGTPTP